MSALPEPQIINLEITVAHQGKAIDELSVTVSEQWQAIDKLQKKLDALTLRFLTLEETATPAIESAKPPHW